MHFRTTIIAMTDTQGTCHNYRAVPNDKVLRETVFTHLRYHMFPDGGTARLRIYGEVHVDWHAKASASVRKAIRRGGSQINFGITFFGSIYPEIAPDIKIMLLHVFLLMRPNRLPAW